MGIYDEYFKNTAELENTYGKHKTIVLMQVGDFYEVYGLKDKETNRILSVESELKKMNSTKIVDTYKDHRMAMSFSPLCLKYGELQVNNIEVVSKSYLHFWEDLQKGGFTIVPSTD